MGLLKDGWLNEKPASKIAMIGLTNEIKEVYAAELDGYKIEAQASAKEAEIGVKIKEVEYEATVDAVKDSKENRDSQKRIQKNKEVDALLDQLDNLDPTKPSYSIRLERLQRQLADHGIELD